MTRSMQFTLGLVIAWMASTGFASAQEEVSKTDPTGTWKWERTFGENTMQFTLRLKQRDGKLSGQFASIRNDEADEPVEIEEAILEGDQLSFVVTRSFNDQEFTIAYEGKVSDGAINGLIKADFGGQAREFEWEATRGLDWADVLGTWNLAFETPNGTIIESILELAKDDDEATGTITSERFGEREVKEIAIKDAQLTFVVVVEREGDEFRINYKVDPRGDALKGTIQVGEGDNARSFEFSGQRPQEEVEKEGSQE